jgi:hypothetical protein
MSKVMRIALEGEREEEVIVVKGPLGQAVTQALNVSLAKVDSVTGDPTIEGGTALESQAQDITVMQKLINTVNADPSEDAPEGIEIYGVNAAEVTPETVVEVVNDMDNSDDDHDYVVIADAAAPQNLTGEGETPAEVVDVNNPTPALEALRSAVKAKGGKFFFSLEEFKEEYLPDAGAANTGGGSQEPQPGVNKEPGNGGADGSGTDGESGAGTGKPALADGSTEQPGTQITEE